MLIAQISDTHITAAEPLAGRIDPVARLTQAVARIERLDVRPDCVLLSGDLTDCGDAESYAVLRTVLARLSMPVYAIPGNHDRREALRAAFADCAWMPRTYGSRLYYAVDLGPIELIALDTLVEGEDYGLLGEAQLRWLDRRLTATSARPAVVMLHHPPVNSGLAAMDAIKLRDAAAFGAIVASHPQIERVLCGHLHRSMHVRWRNTVVSVPSSTVVQMHLALAADAPLATVREPPGLQLHYWDVADGVITHNVPI